MPAKIDDAVWLMYRSACIAGKHRSHRGFAVLVGAGLAREEDGAAWLMYCSACIAGKHRSHRGFAVLAGAGLAREER